MLLFAYSEGAGADPPGSVEGKIPAVDVPIWSLLTLAGTRHFAILDGIRGWGWGGAPYHFIYPVTIVVFANNSAKLSGTFRKLIFRTGIQFLNSLHNIVYNSGVGMTLMV